MYHLFPVIINRRRMPVISTFCLILFFIWYSIHAKYSHTLSSLSSFLDQDQDKLCSNQSPLSSSSSIPTENIHSLYQLTTPDTHLRPDVWKDLPTRGAFYMMARNNDLYKVKETIKSIEDRFNSQNSNSSHYPYILLNNQPFTPEFKKYIRRTIQSPERIYFGHIDLEAWTYPYWIDTNQAEALMLRHEEIMSVPRSHSTSYHQMARYQTGLFFHHPLFESVEYTWRLTAGSLYTCDMTFNHTENDPFKMMHHQDKKIGFAITTKESISTMYSLWPTVVYFMKQYPHLIQSTDESVFGWLLDKENGWFYSQCTFWSNFEIVSLSWLRSHEYEVFFQYLDLVGGFFYERWNEGAVRAIAAALFLKKEDVAFLNQVGYQYGELAHCPFNEKLLEKCSCDYMDSYDRHENSCTLDLLRYINPSAIDDMVDFAKSKLGYYNRTSN